MDYKETTAVPNILFDGLLPQLKVTELKVLLIVIRQTIGWKEKRSSHRKSEDWISSSQLKKKSGSSARSICSAVESLVKRNFIEVLDENHYPLVFAHERRGKQRLYYRVGILLKSSVDNQGIPCAYPEFIASPSANNAEHFSKNITALAHKMHITKETLQN